MAYLPLTQSRGGKCHFSLGCFPLSSMGAAWPVLSFSISCLTYINPYSLTQTLLARFTAPAWFPVLASSFPLRIACFTV